MMLKGPMMPGTLKNFSTVKLSGCSDTAHQGVLNMESPNEIAAEQIVRTDFVSVDPDAKLSKILSVMEENNLRDIPVVEDGDLCGMISYRELMDRVHTDPTNMTAEKVMHQPPEVDIDTSIVEMAAMRRDSGERTFVVLEGDTLRGIVTEEDIAFCLDNDVEGVRGIRVEDLMTMEVITIGQDEPHDRATKLMQDNNISRLPVLDADSELIGVIRSQDVLKQLGPRVQIRNGEIAPEKDEISDIPCAEIMARNPAYITDPTMHLADAVQKMEKLDFGEIIVTDDNDHPTAVLTVKDVLDYLSSLEERDAVLVNLIGVKEDGQKEAIHSKIETGLKGRLGRVVNNPKELTMHIKTYEKDGEQKKYSLHAKYFSELGITMAKDADWDLMNLVDDIIDTLYEQAREEKERKRDRVRDQWKNGKYAR